FGEVYFSKIFPGKVKAWHRHRSMVRNYAVPVGQIRLVLFDERNESPSKGRVQEIALGGDNYNLVVIPPMVWSGFACIGSETALVANCASLAHDPKEAERIEPDDARIPYRWKS